MVRKSTAGEFTKPPQKMSVDEFLAWSHHRSGRFELLHGEVFEMQAERRRHAKVKLAVQIALSTALRGAKSPCEVLPDGMAVRIDRDGWFQPDALVHCDTSIDLDAIEIANPIVVVEVLSPSTQSFDMSYKLAGYFSLPSVVHYLVINPVKMPLVHHARRPDGTILTQFVSSGTIKLDPPGIELNIDGLLE
jgi:Uma2 family endonuclease